MICYSLSMPGRNVIKEYVEDSYYHLYNRGVEKRTIFQDDQDYGVFLSYLKAYLLDRDEKGLHAILADPEVSPQEKDKIRKLLRLNNFADEITLVAYCLMPNHFHLFVKQRGAKSIHAFMQSFTTRYTMYFNRKYKRVGSLFQAVYKAVRVSTDEQLLYLSKYIHKQALHSKFLVNGLNEQPSSYAEYLNMRNTAWVHPEDVLNFFSKNRVHEDLSYEAFVEENDEHDSYLLKNVSIA